MVISDLEFYLVEIGCVGRNAPVRSLVVRLSADTGIKGWGEARVPWRPTEVAARRDWLLPVLTGRSIFDIEELLGLETMRDAPLRCAIEMASWDLVGRSVRQPLCHLFGGGYRQRIPLSARLAPGAPQQVAQAARELADRGYHSQVLTSCGRYREDLDTLAAVREIALDRVEIRLDAAESFSVDDARDLCNHLDEELVQLVIDPLRGGDLDQVASLRRQVNTPLAVWRPIQRPSDVLALVRCGAAASVTADLQLVGGIVPARKCATIAQAAGTSVSLGSGPSLGIALAAMLQLAAATPVLSSCSESSHHQLEDDLLLEPLDTIDGMIAVPQGPGLGVEIDRSKIEQYQVTR